MPRLDESQEAICGFPEQFGLQCALPIPRGDWPTLPIDVTKCDLEAHGVRLEYKLPPGSGPHTLAPSDVIWNQASNMVALVVQRVDHRVVRCIGLVAPDTAEELETFLRAGSGLGTWMLVGMAWLPEWELPSELTAALPTLVDLDSEGAIDHMPEGARSRPGWVAEGKIDPDRPLSPAQRRFFAKQRAAMAQLAGAMEEMTDEELKSLETSLPKPGELEKGEAVETVIPLEPEKPKGRILSYDGQTLRSKPDE